MKKKKAAAIKSQNPVEVIISVTEFRDVLTSTKPRTRELSGRETDYCMALKKEDPRAYINGSCLYVKRPGAPIEFSLVAGDGEKEKYFPVGITFVRHAEQNEDDEERLGLWNFRQDGTHAKRHTLSVVDSYSDKKSARYKFSVIIQRGSDGAIGIIDPDIIHDDL